MYAITGATGHTGTVIVNRLLAERQPVRAIGRSADRLQPLAAKGAEPFVAELTDREALARAFRGARAVYAMIPPSMASPDYRAEQDRVTAALAGALAGAGVKYVVSLSSVGADKAEGTGPVVGLHHLEQKLNRIAGLSALHLRAAYFMENTLGQVGVIQSLGLVADALRPDLKLPMIATRDIGAAAADALLRLDFSGQQARELLGQRDLSMKEVAAIIGEAIGRPDLAYFQAPPDQVRAGLAQLGMSAKSADLILEMAAALNSGHMKALEPRSPRNTTPTPYETFVAEEFVPRYRSRSAGA